MKKTMGSDKSYPVIKRLLLAPGMVLLLLGPPTVLENRADAQELPTELTLLSISERESLEDACLPIQFRDGASAYRQCLLNQLEQQTKDVIGHFEALSFDEKYAVQQACQSTQRPSGQTYHQCLSLQVREAVQLPAPNLIGISEDERYVLRQSCFQAQTQSGAQAYRRCLNNEIDNLHLLPRVDLSTLTSLDRNAIQISCSPAHAKISAVEYRLCINREIETSGLLRKTSTPTQQTKPDRATMVAMAANPVTPGLAEVRQRTSVPVASSDDLRQLPTEERGGNVGVYFANTETATNREQSVQDSKTRVPGDQVFGEVITLKAALAADDTAVTTNGNSLTQNRWLFAIPLIVLLSAMHGLYLLLRKRPQEFTFDREVVNPPMDFSPHTPLDDAQFEPGKQPAYPQGAVDAGWDEFTEELSQPDSEERELALSTGNDYTESTEFDQTQVTARPEADVWTHRDQSVHDHDLPADQQEATVGYTASDDEVDQTLHINATGATEFTNYKTPEVIPPMLSEKPIQPRSRFGLQLQASSSEVRHELITEFLLYWVSYCDGNISASRAEKILQTQPRDEHDRIKQWVLEKDQDALTDALFYLRMESSDSIMQQTLLMMMCVIVEDRLTPLQNTFFRFFADLSGLGTDGLQRLYRSHFGRILPAMPRPDSVNWWRMYKDGTESALSGTPEDLSAQQLQAQLELLEYRFDPAHFNQLSEKAQRLIQRHAEKRRKALHSQGVQA